MSKKVPVVKITTPDGAGELAGLPLEATVAMSDVAAAMREGLLAFSTAAGLVVMQQMLTAELASIVGEKHAKLGAERVGNWHGTTTGQVVLGSRKVTVARPRGRYVDGGEVELAAWEAFASEDLLRQVVVERMLAGVATRRHVDVTEPVGVEGTAVSRSAVSRRFKAATEAAMGELLARDLSSLQTAVLMIDGLNVADQMITVALIITADGTKVPVGLVLGDTENSVVVTDLLADLVARGLRFEHGILAVLDGSKALRKAVVKVFGERALVQRCTLHKRRNVIGYLPVDVRDAIDRRLAQAFAEPDPAKGLAACRNLARQLDGAHPDAAASLREGLEEMFTVARLGVTGRLRRSLTNTNCIESMISITRTTTGRVKHWRTGTMKKRWIAAGMLEAERSSAASRVTPTCRPSSRPSPEPCHTHQLRSGRLSKLGITTELQHEAGHPPLPGVELGVFSHGVIVAGDEVSLDVCDVRNLGTLYERLIDRLVKPDTRRQACDARVVDPGVSYHPWYPVLAIGGDKSRPLLLTATLVPTSSARSVTSPTRRGSCGSACTSRC